MTGGKASEFRGRGLASGAWMGGRVRGRLKGHGVVRSGVNLDGVGVNPGESESSIGTGFWRLMNTSKVLAFKTFQFTNVTKIFPVCYSSVFTSTLIRKL